MTSPAVSRTATLLARVILGIIFALSGLTKLSSPGIFQADVTAYHLLPATLVGPFALALPWIEALLAIYLLLGLFLRPAAIVAAGLLLMFTAALTINITTGNTAHGCGCLQGTGLLDSLPLITWLFGGMTVTFFDVARDLVLTGLAAVIYWGDTSVLSLDGLLFGDGEPERQPIGYARSAGSRPVR